MKCEQCLPFVEDYFDGELDARTTELVERHLSACAPCVDAYRKLENEQKLYLSYECDVRPAPDFWANVILKVPGQNNVTPTGFLAGLRQWIGRALGGFSVPRFSPSLTALIVLIAVGITAGLMRYLNSSEKRNDAPVISQNHSPSVNAPVQKTTEITPPVIPAGSDSSDSGSKPGKNVQTQPAKNSTGKAGMVLAVNRAGAERSSRKTAKSDSALTPDELIHQAEQKYIAAITILSRDVRNRRSQLDAESAARFEQTLAAIDRTIADTRRAVRENPGDPVAAQYMLTAYAKKVDVLREMIGY